MSHRLFRRLRRCRVLFALALCSWLAMASVAWARPELDCASAMGAMGMAMQHGAIPDQGHAPHTTMEPDSCCVHGAVSVPPASAPRPPYMHAASQAWPATDEAAPQPFVEPPLRPPVA
ncbi:hypothetical protein [Dyella solisilvae]|nr:hypothetical protein [Dyella solisilvae]